jgi:hypothetical protein
MSPARLAPSSELAFGYLGLGRPSRRGCSGSARRRRAAVDAGACSGSAGRGASVRQGRAGGLWRRAARRAPRGRRRRRQAPYIIRQRGWQRRRQQQQQRRSSPVNRAAAKALEARAALALRLQRALARFRASRRLLGRRAGRLRGAAPPASRGLCCCCYSQPAAIAGGEQAQEHISLGRLVAGHAVRGILARRCSHAAIAPRGQRPGGPAA